MQFPYGPFEFHGQRKQFWPSKNSSSEHLQSGNTPSTPNGHRLQWTANGLKSVDK